MILTESSLFTHSAAWKKFSNLLDYVLDLSPRNLRNIRIHTEIFSGEFCNEILFQAQNYNPAQYAEDLGYTFATEELQHKYWLSEPAIETWEGGPIGCQFGDVVINPEISRYQLYFENFVSTGMMNAIENSKQKSVILEIGAGYGVIGHHLHRLARGNVCYVVVDLPLMLLYTGCYIAANNPELKILIYDPADLDKFKTEDDILDYDVVLIPNHRLSILESLSKIDYAINTISMAEMTLGEVEKYLNFIKPRLNGYFFFQNYLWDAHLFPKPLHHLVSDYFKFIVPNLNFYEEYMEKIGRSPHEQFARTFFYTNSDNRLNILKESKIKLRLPDSRAAQIDLSSEQIFFRSGCKRYFKFGSLRDTNFLMSQMSRIRLMNSLRKWKQREPNSQ